MLAVAGFLMIIVFMVLIMTKKLAPMLALMIVPILFALGLGFGPGIGKMAMAGVKQVAPTGVMLFFAIIYFSLMLEAGLFAPLVKKVLIWVKGDPLKICVGTAILATGVSFDGDGSTTYLITTAALYTIHRKVGIKPVILPTIVILCNSVLNIIPWGGPTARVMAALHLEIGELFNPMIPGMVVGALYIWAFSYYLGKKERARIGTVALDEQHIVAQYEASITEEEKEMARPKLIWFNLILTVVLFVTLMADVVPSAIIFMVGTALALMVNYPKSKEQSARLISSGSNAIPVVGMVFAAGIFTGIMSGTKMIDVMAQAIVNAIPASMGPHMGFISAFLSLPGVFFLTNDAYYFGVLPVLNQAANSYGVPTAMMGIASLIGQGAHLLSPLVPSTYLLVGLNKIEFGDLQRYALLPAIGLSFCMLIVALLRGIVTI